VTIAVCIFLLCFIFIFLLLLVRSHHVAKIHFLIRPDLVEELDQELLGRQIWVNNAWTKSDRPPKILVKLNQVRQGLQLKTIFATSGMGIRQNERCCVLV